MGDQVNTGILLDVDGTLVNTESLHLKTWQQSFQEHGHHFSIQDFNSLFGLDPIPLVITRLGCTHEKAAMIADRKAALFRDKAADVRAFPGAAGLLTEARQHGLLIALVSSTSRADVENYLLPCIGPRNSVDLVVTGEMVTRGKPQPDVLKLAMDTLGISAARALTAGDTIFDMAAGVKAGVTVVGKTPDPARAKRLTAAGAHFVVPNLDELREFIRNWLLRLATYSPGF